MAAGDDASMPEASPSGAVLTIDLGALAANWRLLRDRVAPAECAAVIKADAYGIGVEPAFRALAAAGCRTFFVAHLSEALRVRALDGNATVYAFNGLLPGSAPNYIAADIRPVLGSRDEVAEWSAACRAAGRQAPAALHVDTGMNRLGLPVAEALDARADPVLSGLSPALLISHFVGAEEPDEPATPRQIGAFAELRSRFSGVPASLANSSGIFLPERPFHDLVRPGYALYGGNPVPGEANPMAPVVRLEVPVLQVREVGPGETVGYNGRWTAPGRRRLVVLSVGYADGYPRAASATDDTQAAALPRGAALVAGRLCPFAGRVSMDLLVIDVTVVPPDQVQRGTPATLIGDALDIDAVASRAGTIGYELLTGLGRRYRRRYVGG